MPRGIVIGRGHKPAGGGSGCAVGRAIDSGSHVARGHARGAKTIRTATPAAGHLRTDGCDSNNSLRLSHTIRAQYSTPVTTDLSNGLDIPELCRSRTSSHVQMYIYLLPDKHKRNVPKVLAQDTHLLRHANSLHLCADRDVNDG